jgi:hypothetical protein
MRTKVQNPPTTGVENLNNYNYTYNGTGIMKLLIFNEKVVARVIRGIKCAQQTVLERDKPE